MTAIICLDNENGALFHGRRQSQDRELRNKILQLAGDRPILMSEYSAKQFSKDANIIGRNDFPQMASAEDICFIEDIEIPWNQVDQLIIFRWNRRYPSDVYFNKLITDLQFVLYSTEDFAGYSHEKITMEQYRRC